MSQTTSRGDAKPVAFAHSIRETVVDPLKSELANLSTLQNTYREAMGAPDTKIAERIEEIQGRVARLSGGIERCLSRAQLPFVSRLSNMHMLTAPNADVADEMMRQRASSERYFAQVYPGLFASAAPVVPSSLVEAPRTPDLHECLNALERTLSTGIITQPNRLEQQLSERQKTALLKLLATAAIEADCGSLENARGGRVTSSTLITRAVLSFGGDVRKFDKALLHARDSDCLDNEEGYTRRAYVFNPHLLHALREGMLDTDETAHRWPTLAQIATLRAQVESRDIEVALREPTNEQVNRTATSLEEKVAKDRFLKEALVHLLKLTIQKPGSDPSFTSMELVSCDRDASWGSAMFAKRVLQRMGLTDHREDNMRSEEYLTELGTRVLEHPGLSPILWKELTSEGHGSLQEPAPSVAVGELHEETTHDAEISAPVVVESVAYDPIQTLQEITGATEEAAQDALNDIRHLRMEEVSARLLALKERLGDEPMSVQQVVTELRSKSFWKDIYRPEAV